MKVHVIGNCSVDIEKQRNLAAATSQLSDNCSHCAVISLCRTFFFLDGLSALSSSELSESSTNSFDLTLAFALTLSLAVDELALRVPAAGFGFALDFKA